MKFILVVMSVLLPSASYANCKVTNDTNFSFTVSSGRTSNQRIPARTTTHVSAGKIVGVASDGTTIGGYCDDSDELVIKLVKGVPVLLPK